MPLAMKNMRRMLADGLSVKGWKIARYVHIAICVCTELSDNEGNDGDRAK